MAVDTYTRGPPVHGTPESRTASIQRVITQGRTKLNSRARIDPAGLIRLRAFFVFSFHIHGEPGARRRRHRVSLLPGAPCGGGCAAPEKRKSGHS